MDDKIPEGLDDLLNELMGESKEDSSPEGLDDLLKSIRDEVKDDAEVEADKSSGAIIVIPKKKEEQDIPEGLDDLLKNIRDEDLVEEEIDSRILEVLGLTDAFDLTYGEYKTLLRERAAASRMGDSTMSTELTELITNEFKRVKGKEGKFKIRKKKVDIDSVFSRKAPSPEKQQLDPRKLLPPDETVPGSNLLEGVVEQNTEIINGLSLFSESLEGIKSLLSKQLQADKKEEKDLRKETQKDKKKQKESKLESKKKKDSKLDTKTLTSPVSGFFNSIKKYFGNILAGSVVVGLLKWLKDPRNERSVNNFKEFFIKQGPLILGGILALALLPVASTLLSFTGAIISGIGILTKALGGLGGLLLKIPGVGAAAAAAAPALAAIGISTVGAVGTALLMKATYDAIRGEISGGGDFAKVDEQLRKKLSGYGITETGMAIKKGSRKQQKLSASQQKVYEEIRGKRDALRKLKEERDVELAKHYTQRSPRSARVLTEKGKEIKRQYEQKALELFGGGQTQVQPKPDSPVQPQTPLMPGLPPSAAQPGTGYEQKALELFGGGQTQVQPKPDSPVQPQTPLMPGLPPSAAQPGTGPASNLVGGGSVVEYITGDATHPNFEYEGHGTTENYHDHIAFRTKEDKERAKLALQQAGIQIGSEDRPWDADSYHGQGLAIDIPGVQWGGKGAIGETEYTGSRKVRAVLASAGFSGAGLGNIGLSNAQPKPARVSRSPITTPSISPLSPRPSLTPLPLPISSSNKTAATSSSSPSQTPVPMFSSEDPNNMTMMVVKGIYNIVG
jgi:hypothetical protein